MPTRETIELAKQEGDRPVVPTGSGGREGTRQFPADPVCMEVPVRIHGSEVTSPVPGVTVHSELFHEETRTLIVFPQGAVVRLSASVTQGQALVLTNQRTTEEVACRVVNVRSSSNIEDYVELEFTRSAPGFWGISFPSEASSATASTRPAASAQPKFEGPAGAVPPPPSAATVSDAKSNTDFSTGTPSVKFPAEIPAPADRPVQPAAIVGTKKKEEPPAVDAPAAELTARATEVEPPPPGPAPSQEVSSVTQQSKGPTEASVPMEVSAPAEPRMDEPPATGSLDQESAGVGAEAELAALVSETISLLAASEAQAKAPVMPAPPTREEKPSTARPPTADSFPASFERTERGARTARKDRSVPRTLAARLASHLAARPEFAKHPLRGKLTLVFVAVSVVALVLGGTWLLLRHYPASPAATSVTQNPIAVQTPAPTDAVSQLVPASEPPGTQPEASAAAGSQTSLIAPAPAPTAAAPKEQLKQSADNKRVPRAFSKLSTRLVPPRSVSVSADAPPVPTIGSEVTSGMPGGQSSSAVGAVMPGVSRPGLAPAPPPPGQAQVPPRVGGQVKEPRLVSAAKPVYPSIARQSGVEGDVVVETEIDATGRVTRMKVVSGPGLLRQAAMDALRQWKYEPGMLDGQAIAVEIQVTIRFRLR